MIRYVCLICFTALSLVFFPNAFAQQERKGGIIDPPVTENGKAYFDYAQSRWQRTQAQYLTEDADPELGPVSEKPKVELSAPSGTRGGISQLIATLFLVLFFLGILFFWWNNRTGGGLFNTKPADGRVGGAVDDAVNPMLEADAQGQISLNSLMEISNPREGIRVLMVQALARAARQNDIVLRRSLTTRDILRRVPVKWQHRAILRDLVSRAELVLFGGRDISIEEYRAAVEFAAPLLEKKRFSRGSA